MKINFHVKKKVETFLYRNKALAGIVFPARRHQSERKRDHDEQTRTTRSKSLLSIRSV